MSDVGIDTTEKGPRLRGTFGPGRHEVSYRWQLPYTGDKEVSFDLPMPPNVVGMRLMAPASQEMTLSGEGFPPAEPQADGQGQRVLITERQLVRGDKPWTTLRFSLRNIPVQGPARLIVTALAGLVVLVGVLFGKRVPRNASAREKNADAERSLLLSDLEELEKARRNGDVGPKTYEQARRQLIDALARTLPVPASASQGP
jgi:hypothetical protein